MLKGSIPVLFEAGGSPNGLDGFEANGCIRRCNVSNEGVSDALSPLRRAARCRRCVLYNCRRAAAVTGLSSLNSPRRRTPSGLDDKFDDDAAADGGGLEGTVESRDDVSFEGTSAVVGTEDGTPWPVNGTNNGVGAVSRAVGPPKAGKRGRDRFSRVGPLRFCH